MQVFAKGDLQPSNEYLPYMCGRARQVPVTPQRPTGPPPPGTSHQVAFNDQGSPENQQPPPQQHGGGIVNHARTQQEQPVASIAASHPAVAAAAPPAVYYPQSPPPQPHARPCRESAYGSKSLGYHALVRRSLLENEQSKPIKKSKRSVSTVNHDNESLNLMKRSKLKSGPQL